MLWSSLGLGALAVTGLSILILPGQSQSERDLMEQRAAIQAFETHEEDNEVDYEIEEPQVTVKTVEYVETGSFVLITGRVRTWQVDDDRVAVAVRIEFPHELRYGWTELSLDRGESAEFEVAVDSPEGPEDGAVDAVGTDWHV